jgi:hypothetical protein
MMKAGYRASPTEVEPLEWMVATPATLAYAVDVVEDLEVGNLACAYYDGPTPMLKKKTQCHKVQAWMTTGYKAVLTTWEPQEWMVQSAVNSDNAIDVTEELQPGSWACSDYTAPVGVLR